MASHEWSLASYLASLAQNAASVANKTSEMNNSDYRGEIDDQRIFAELKPASNSETSGVRPKETTEERMLQFLAAATGYGFDGQNVFESRQVKTEQSIEDYYSDTSEECVIEQPLISWDLNRLSAFGNDAIIGDVVVDEELKVSSEENTYDSNYINDFTIAAESLHHERNKPLGQQSQSNVKEDEFKFPQCIEEQFREMVLKSNKQEDWRCKKCGNNLVQEDKMQSQGAKVGEIECTKMGHEATYAMSRDNHNQITGENKERLIEIVRYGRDKCTIDRNDSGAVEMQNLSNFINKSVTANIQVLNTEKIARVQGNDFKIENIDELITRINPDLDVLGKTFHKIPSTQPIYCDNESREDEDGNDQRIKRPMNAFMLWARKYRSLVAKEFSEASNSEISVKLGEIWNELTSEQQRPYFKRAESLKAQHKQNHPNYVYQPRTAAAKPTKKGKNGANNVKDGNAAFGALPVDFGTPFAFFGTTKTQGPKQSSQFSNAFHAFDGDRETKRTESEQKERVMMAPTPIYPVGFQDKLADEKQLGKTIEENENTMQAGSIDYENEMVQKSQEESYDKSDTGLVRDAMLPRPERTGDECDLISNGFQSLNIAALDDFLAGGCSDLSEYFGGSVTRKGREGHMDKPNRKNAKRKRRLATEQTSKRQKHCLKL